MSDAVDVDETAVQRALKPPPPIQLVPVPPHVAAPTSAVFGSLSRWRGRRAMHPVGVVATATLTVPPTGRLPEQWRALDEATGIVRFSKSIGLPRHVPDVLGIALRFGGQDLLLASVLGAAPGLQHVLAPAAGFDGTTFSTLLPHRVGTGVAVIQARLSRRLPPAAGYLEAIEADGVFTMELAAAGLLGGRRPLGTVTVGEVIHQTAAERVRFDPWRAGGGLRPVGPLQRIRSAAYAASRRATSR